MDTIIINSENSEAFKSHALIPKLTDKLDLRRGEKSIFFFYQILAFTIH